MYRVKQIVCIQGSIKPQCEDSSGPVRGWGAEKLTTSSVQVVRGQPGFLGYLVAGPPSVSQGGRNKSAAWAGMARVTVAARIRRADRGVFRGTLPS